MKYNIAQIMLEIIKNNSELTFKYNENKKVSAIHFDAFLKTRDMINPLMSLELRFNSYDYDNEVVIPLEIRIYNSFAGEEGDAIYFDLDEIDQLEKDEKNVQFIKDCEYVLNNRIGADFFESEFDEIEQKPEDVIYNVFTHFFRG